MTKLTKILGWTLGWIWACRHPPGRRTFPMRRVDGRDTQSCLECGKVLDYKAEWIN